MSFMPRSRGLEWGCICRAALCTALAVAVAAWPALADDREPVEGPTPEQAPPADALEAVPSYWHLIPAYQDVPEYTWYYGCSPTAAGMLLAWWDAQPGRHNLFDGDASAWYGNGEFGTKRMVASTAHQVAGAENGYTYGDWHKSSSYPDHEANPSCLADFMQTVDAATYRNRIASGLRDFAAWDDPTTAVSESYAAVARTYYTFDGWGFEDFKAEIAAGRPVHLGITSHSVLAFGWWDLSTPADPDNYGYVCYTTWSGWGMRQWRWDGQNVPDERSVYAATYLYVVPEPHLLGLILVGALVPLLRRVRRPRTKPL
ncbi:MAG: hypothetical protein AMK72_03980 [Planctomycetes bacterium SM23_25]|nr:MAG: hypothetical protein AMK72_03980 [Planctomycetes bacterium SM23_25]